MRVLILYLFAIASAYPQVMTLSDHDSQINFVIKNFGLEVDGTLKGLSGQFIIREDTVEKSYFKASVRSETVDTGNSLRDKHLRGENYFDSKTFPVIRIESNKITRSSGQWRAVATLTMKGVSKTIEFPFTVEGSKTAYILKGTFSINRRDFDVGGNSVSLSDTVEVRLRVKGTGRL